MNLYYIVPAMILFVLETNILGLTTLLIGKCFHLKLFTCQFLCFRWVTENGKLQLKITNFRLAPEIMNGRMDLTPKEDWAIVTIKLFLQACFCVIVFFLTRPLADEKMRFVLVVTSLIIFGISLFLILNTVANGSGALGRLIKVELFALCNSTEPITKIAVPLNEVTCKYTQREAATYQLLRATQLWYTDQIDAMKEPIEWLDNYTNKEFEQAEKVLLSSVMYYYTLLTYYTLLRPNTNKAIILYERVKSILLQDNDANGKRILACYQYYIESNPSAALVTARQAQIALATFSTPGREREMERRLITDLLATLENKAI